MYGWRAKLGIIIPSNNTILEPEFARMVPEGVSVHAARILTAGTSLEAIVEMERNASRALRELHAGGVDAIGYACMATALVKGPGWAERFIEEARRDAQLPTTTAVTATMDGLRACGATRVAVASPYPDGIHRLLPAFFEHYGLHVVRSRNLDIKDALEVCRVPSSAAYRLARAVDCSEAQAVCIVATDFQTVDIIAALEQDLRKPVVTTNQALLWQSLALAGIGPAVTGYGQLFAQATPPPKGDR
jgi:maleate cis-trans isomerase